LVTPSFKAYKPPTGVSEAYVSRTVQLEPSAEAITCIWSPEPSMNAWKLTSNVIAAFAKPARLIGPERSEVSKPFVASPKKSLLAIGAFDWSAAVVLA
jgi:hypothetical protein